jgi:hypothetical protein
MSLSAGGEQSAALAVDMILAELETGFAAGMHKGIMQ